MARSKLFRDIAKVRGRVAEQLGETIPVTLHRADPTNRDTVTGEPCHVVVGIFQATVDGSSGVSVGTDKTDPGSRLAVTVFDPDLLVTEEDFFTWGVTRTGEDPDRHRVRKVIGRLQDVDGSRYVTRCEVD